MNMNIHKIAQKAGVSIATVSRALNNSPYIKESTKKKVLEIVKELNYHPNINAKRLVQRKSNNIGIIFPYNKNIFMDWYLTEMLNFLQIEINKLKLDFSLYFPEEKDFSYLKYFFEESVDGMIIGGVAYKDKNIKKLVEYKYPFLLLGSYVKGLKYNYVDVDNKDVVEKGIDFLYEYGHRKIGALLNKDYFSTGIDRKEAFYNTLNSLGLEINDEFIFSESGDFYTSYKISLEILKKKNRPTVIFAMSDTRAAAIYKAAYELGLKIPDDISVLGVNNIFITTTLLYPPLTTVSIPRDKMATTVVNNLLILLKENKRKVPPKIFKSKLIIRDSVKKII